MPAVADEALQTGNGQSHPATLPDTLQGRKSLFRVSLYQSSSAEDGTEKVYHARRAHRKSRAGCVKCKQRRVKVLATSYKLLSPFLMHAIIGAATSHLRRIYPENNTYTMVEAYHWQKAIKQYSEEISTAVGPHNMDPLYSACLLMTIHSFSLEEYNPRSSFVFSDDPESLNWLMLQSGLRYLLQLTVPWMTQSMWWDVFKRSREGNPLYDDHRPGRVDLHPELADICGIDDSTTEETNPYHWPLRMLTPLLSLERSLKTFTHYTNYMGRLLPDYYDQLLKKDPPALIILSWWLALIVNLDVWWMETRAKSECVAICMYLEESDDPRILSLLEFPAQACGYLLKHVQERIERQYDLVVL
ncbi:hypothetical protein BDV30DRAFT_229383 [Aspergillus minisclerotigenes]|uniref:C6 transcription factor n=1 Tax=Aspergillus minisclerotigenes TaxID=656917 RepID=A0A5N6IXA8_9EURO|nr:hypothetical protein BDV30DRAFT_229383 [Aspergillus minisclerotigenes]